MNAEYSVGMRYWASVRGVPSSSAPATVRPRCVAPRSTHSTGWLEPLLLANHGEARPSTVRPIGFMERTTSSGLAISAWRRASPRAVL